MAVELDNVEVVEAVEGLEQRQLRLFLGPLGGTPQAVEPVWYWGSIVAAPSTLDQSLLNLGEADDPRAITTGE